MKYIICLILLIILTFGIKASASYPVLLSILGIGWCITGALLLYYIINYILNKITK